MKGCADMSEEKKWQIHRRMFEGVLDNAGQIRTYNITKKEWVLNGNTVTYASLECTFEELMILQMESDMKIGRF